MTKYGKLIADLVLASYDHPTAEDIYMQLREQGSQISLATVYNNLKTLVEEGVLRKITLDGSPDRFDRAGQHQHLICVHCGKLVDVDLDDMTDIISAQLGRKILSYELRVQYLCEDCAARMHKVEK